MWELQRLKSGRGNRALKAVKCNAEVINAEDLTVISNENCS